MGGRKTVCNEIRKTELRANAAGRQISQRQELDGARSNARGEKRPV